MVRLISTFSSRNNLKSGMTLVELLISMVVVLIILGITYLLYFYGIKQSFSTIQYAHNSISIQKASFLITKYLHNASTAVVLSEMPTNPGTNGNYIFFKSSDNSVYKLNVNSTNLSTTLLSSNVSGLLFQVTTGSTHAIVKMTVSGYKKLNIKTDVTLNNSKVSSPTSFVTGTALFFK